MSRMATGSIAVWKEAGLPLFHAGNLGSALNTQSNLTGLNANCRPLWFGYRIRLLTVNGSPVKFCKGSSGHPLRVYARFLSQT